jgi:hypothetical protein
MGKMKWKGDFSVAKPTGSQIRQFSSSTPIVSYGTEIIVFQIQTEIYGVAIDVSRKIRMIDYD